MTRKDILEELRGDDELLTLLAEQIGVEIEADDDNELSYQDIGRIAVDAMLSWPIYE